eukprot:scaffold1130_cov195-Pinguiococcus_pyrenoidosus.AAC.84
MAHLPTCVHAGYRLARGTEPSKKRGGDQARVSVFLRMCKASCVLAEVILLVSRLLRFRSVLLTPARGRVLLLLQAQILCSLLPVYLAHLQLAAGSKSCGDSKLAHLFGIDDALRLQAANLLLDVLIVHHEVARLLVHAATREERLKGVVRLWPEEGGGEEGGRRRRRRRRKKEEEKKEEEEGGGGGGGGGDVTHVAAFRAGGSFCARAYQDLVLGASIVVHQVGNRRKDLPLQSMNPFRQPVGALS